MSEYLKMPWSVEDTIENLEFVKELYKNLVRRGNLDGKGDEDAEEIEFDFNRAIEALEQTRWIPVSERLPENYKDVFVQWQRISRFDNTIKVFLHTGFLNEYGEWLHADGLGVFNGEVIAWMPLPEPYKAGEQE